MTQPDIIKAFTFTDLTLEQKVDLGDLHDAAQELALTLYKVLQPQAAQQLIGQLIGIVSQARMSIELQPRAGEGRIQMVTH